MKAQERWSVQQYKDYLSGKGGQVAGPRRAKYGNKQVIVNGEAYDSTDELTFHRSLLLAQSATAPGDRVVEIRRQVSFELIPAQPGERPTSYIADFVVTYADGRKEVFDVKSEITRKLPAYKIKRKLMLLRHGIAIKEVALRGGQGDSARVPQRRAR